MSKHRHMVRRRLYRRFGHCYWCGDPIARFDDTTLDHFVPRSVGGGGGKDNAVLSCVPCNIRKGDRIPTGEEYDWWMARGRRHGLSQEAFERRKAAIRGKRSHAHQAPA